MLQNFGHFCCILCIVCSLLYIMYALTSFWSTPYLPLISACALWFETAWFWDIQSFIFPRAREWVSEQTNERGGVHKQSKQEGASRKGQAGRSKQEGASEQTSKWPTTYALIHDWSESQWCSFCVLQCQRTIWGHQKPTTQFPLVLHCLCSP